MSKHLLINLCLGVVLVFVLNVKLVLAQNTTPVYPHTFKTALTIVPTTLDPQATIFLANYMLRRYFFDPLFTIKDGETQLVLLDSFRWKTPTQWEFTLKKGVLFHDGSELTSRDVLATFRRAARLKNALYESIKNYQIRVLDTYRFELESPQPDSELLRNLEDLVVIKHTAEQADSESFNNGEHLIGTGPYRLLARKAFREFHLAAFPDYHRGAAYIQNLKMEVEPDVEKRMAAFLSGKIDMMHSQLTQRLSDLRQKANITSKPSHSVYLLSLDTWREQTPDVRDVNGKPLPHNPFKDLRVRQAISKAFDREQLLFQLLGSKNSEQIAGQLINKNAPLYDPTLLPDKQDISEAKRLLREAGYPKGFQVTIRDISDRHHYLKAIAPMLAKIGIQAEVAVLPVDEYFERVDNRAFSAMFYFDGSGGNLAEVVNSLLHSDSKSNSGGYSNPVLDHQIDDALAQISVDLKNRKLREAQRIAIADLGIIPLFFRSESWVVRPDMIYEPTDQLFTEVYYVRPNVLAE